MTSRKVRIIHVGNMANKGTQALLTSDISVIRDIVEDVTVSVSTTECYYSNDFAQKLNLPIISSFPPILDIPYDKVDSYALRYGFERTSVRYKLLAFAGLMNMFKQSVLSILSACLLKLGFDRFPQSQSLRDLKECDFVVSYSNENYKDGNSEFLLNPYWIISWWTMLLSRTWEILMAKFFRKPVIMFPNSVGPFRTFFGRFLTRLSLNNCLCLFIREPISYEVVKSLGITSPKILTSDTALLFESGNSAYENLTHPTIGVCAGIYSFTLSENQVQRYITSHAQALDTAIDQHDFDVIFFPQGISGFPNDDLQVSRLIANEMKHSEKIKIVRVDTAKEFKSYLDKMDMIISSKMHPMVLGVSGTVPVVCIAYDHKQIGFLRYLGMSDCALSINEITCDTLKAKIDLVWESREQRRNMLRARVPLIKQQVITSIRKAVSCV